MNKHALQSLLGCLALLACVLPASAQTSDVKDKPPMYSYVANWTIPRAQWGELAKIAPAQEKMMEKMMSNGSIVGYGDDQNLIHQPDSETHDDWWSSMSMAGLLAVLDQSYSSGNATNPVFVSATKHWDEFYVSRYYNWKPGKITNGYTHVSAYKLKADSSDDALETLSKGLIAPLLEKMLAEGTINEYEIDTEAIHTDAPGTFFIIYITPTAEGLDKVQAAVREMIKNNPMGGQAFGGVTEDAAHRDHLLRTNATFK